MTATMIGPAWNRDIPNYAAIRTSRRVSAVWFAGAMGLLDDAIREHLELKRLRGADPGAVAREEQDALGPLRREREAEQDEQRGKAEVPEGADGSFFPNSEPPRSPDSSTFGQETIEINMEAELATGTDSGHQHDGPKQKSASPVTDLAHSQASTQEPLGWESLGDHDDKPRGVEGSKGGAGSSAEEHHEGVEHVEDVLEETPDFLRETPEQERLWFEQRPPRDFDFNE
jgi:hypothetical protein